MSKKLSLLFCFLCLLGIFPSNAQTRTLKGGVIFSQDGLPAIGAYVLVEGTKIATVTNVDGRYVLEGVPADAKFLVFNYMGAKEKRVPIADNLKVTLDPDAEFISEAVVTGMQKVDKRLFTGSATKVSADDVKLDGMADISRSLEGRVAGVSVQNVSGTFGTAPKIRVRGSTSIYGSSKPLWVVDGVIMEDVVEIDAEDLSSGDASTLISSAIAGLNSDDIESFDILKDGSATSIYGARAMAGVIVVTTKKGRAGQSSLTYNGEYTMRLKPTYNTFNIMNSQDQMGIYQELQQKGWLNYAHTAVAANSGVFGKMYQLLSQYDAASGQPLLINTPQAKAEYLRAAEYRNTDWFDKLFTTSIQHTHSISISGGSEKSNHYTSLSIMDDPGWTLQSDVKRYTANMNVTYKLFRNLSLNLIGNASYRKQRAPGTLSASINAVTGEVKRDFDINPYSYALNTSRTLDPDEFYTRNYAPFNILYELDNNYLDLDVFNMRTQAELKFTPFKSLEFSVLGAVKYSQSSREHHIKDNSNQALAYRAMDTSTIIYNNPFLYTDPDNPYALPVTVLPYGGIFQKTDNSMNGWDFRATASFNKQFGRNHLINLYGGTEINSVDRHATWFRGWGMQYDMGEIANYDYFVFKQGSEDGSDYYTLANSRERRAAFFATGTYSLKGRYIINGTARYEGSNRLGKSRTARWLPTWNVSGRWNVHEEPFMKPLYPVLSHLALKASYSLTGESGPSWVNNSEIKISSDIPWKPSSSLRESILYISSLANEDLTFEKKHELNLGLESGFFDNRINFAFDWYKRNNFDLIGLTNTAGVGGEVTKYGNIASMSSKGVELTLSTTNIKTDNFKWTTSFIYSHSSNVVTSLTTSQRVIDLVSGTGFAQEGYPNHSIFSIPFKGLNEEGLPTFLDQDGNTSVTGIYFQTSDPSKLSFLEFSGTADPTDVGSLGNIFTFKGFTLNVFLTYSFGNVIRLDPVFKSYYTDLSSMPKEFNNRWIVPGDEDKTTVPVIASRFQNNKYSNLGNAYNAYNYSTERIAKGDFIRLKEVSLSYSFPKKYAQFLGMNAMSLKIQGTNLLLLYADKKLNGQDPEFFNTGGVAVPVPKQFTMTLKLGF
ncbi:MAG: SusC/RagA family TonB-linked outer membrane protein [Bacteroidales bacterium]|nr:SusC/RagA family TonB-linked outer membrane protein [Bacteroidales bacterium]MDD6751938.1 SusC/RagA family TonB-linked outer membrane protein [Bacteroidales bacterium]